MVTNKIQNAPTATEMIKIDYKTNKKVILLFANFNREVNFGYGYNNQFISENRVLWNTKPYKNLFKSQIISEIINGTPVRFFARTKNSEPNYIDLGYVIDWRIIDKKIDQPSSIEFTFNNIMEISDVEKNDQELDEQFLQKNADITGLEAENWVLNKLNSGYKKLLKELNIDHVTSVKSTRKINKKAHYDILLNKNIKIEVKAVRNNNQFSASDDQIKILDENGFIILVNLLKDSFRVVKQVDQITPIREIKRTIYEYCK